VVAKVADLTPDPFEIRVARIRNIADFTDANAQRLTRLHELAELEFFETTFAAGALRALAGCPRLESVFVRGGSTTNDTFTEILSIRQLRKLTFVNTAVADDFFAQIGSLPQLVFFNLTGCPNCSDKGLIRMSKAPPPKLQDLGLSGMKLGAEALKELSTVSHLQNLGIAQSQVDAEAIMELRTCPTLAGLWIAGETNMTQAQSTALQQALAGCAINVSKAEQAPVLNGPSYQDAMRRIMGRGFSISVISIALGGMTWIHGDDPFPKGDVIYAVHVWDWGEVPDVRESDLRLIAELSDLRGVNLGKPPPEGLRGLLPLKNLTELILGGNYVLSDADVELLASFPKLSRLDASIPNDAALEKIAKLPHLSLLNIQAASRNTERGLKVLESAATLSGVGLWSDSISHAAAQALANARPDIIVTTKKGRLDPVDPDREVAEWVINNGGKVGIWGKGDFTNVADLPRQPFAANDMMLQNIPNFDEDDAHRLTKLRELRDLFFLETTLNSGAIRALAGCRRLESLAILGGSTTDAVLAEVIQIPQLRHIRLLGVDITDDIIASLGQFPRLQSLDLYRKDRISDAAFTRLVDAPPPKLQMLTVGGTKLGINGFSAISRLPHLQEFEVTGEHVNDAVLREFRHCKALAKVGLATTSVTQAGTNELQTALGGCQVVPSKREQAPMLNGPAYRDTIHRVIARGCSIKVTTNTLGGSAWIRGGDPFPQGDVVFAEAVDGSGSDGDDVATTDLRDIVQLSDLRSFNFNRIPPDGLRELLPLKNLTELILGGNYVLSDADVELLASFPKLSRLIASIPNDAALEKIAKLPHLNWLKFGFKSGITDKGLKALESARVLGDVDLTFTNVSQAAAQALATARPDIIVTTKAGRLEPVEAKINDPAPPPAKAPFDARQARAHQEAWAKHLGLPVEYTNSIGMEFPKSWSDSVDFGSPSVVCEAGF
jgi:hypothetical protein